jgi:hypothetical protein
MEVHLRVTNCGTVSHSKWRKSQSTANMIEARQIVIGKSLTLCRPHHKDVLNQAHQAHGLIDQAPRSRPVGCQDRAQVSDRDDIQAKPRDNSRDLTLVQGVHGYGHLLRASTGRMRG